MEFKRILITCIGLLLVLASIGQADIKRIEKSNKNYRARKEVHRQQKQTRIDKTREQGRKRRALIKMAERNRRLALERDIREFEKRKARAKSDGSGYMVDYDGNIIRY